MSFSSDVAWNSTYWLGRESGIDGVGDRMGTSGANRGSLVRGLSSEKGVLSLDFHVARPEESISPVVKLIGETRISWSIKNYKNFKKVNWIPISVDNQIEKRKKWFERTIYQIQVSAQFAESYTGDDVILGRC